MDGKRKTDVKMSEQYGRLWVVVSGHEWKTYVVILWVGGQVKNWAWTNEDNRAKNLAIAEWLFDGMFFFYSILFFHWNLFDDLIDF